MRITSCAIGFVLLSSFIACGGDDSDDDPPSNGGAHSGATGKGGAGGATSFGGAFGGTLSSGGALVAGTAGMTMPSLGGSMASAGGRSTAGAVSAGDAGVRGDAGDGAGGGAGQGHTGTAGSSAGVGGEAGSTNQPIGLSWPIDCVPNQTCVNLGYPDTDNDGKAHNCEAPGYQGHQGTDIGITFQAQTSGTAVRAAADGVVLFAFDGKYDQCPNANEPDCQDPPSLQANARVGNTVCTPIGPYCGTGEPGCFWCFAGGNVIVLRHQGVPGVFATRYDHLKKNSVAVRPGDTVRRGQKIAEAASAGNSTGPHLHFEVWGTGFYELADPWVGTCGPNHGPTLWANDPPWAG